MEDLTIEMGLGRQLGSDVFTAAEAARRVLSAGGANWIKWAAIGVGAAAVLATGGLALAAVPAGLAGAAAITSALAAFGPGGMIGGLLTGAALVSVGTGGIVVGLASPTTSAETVEAVASTQLAAAILRKSQGIEQDAATWSNLVEARHEMLALLVSAARLFGFTSGGCPGPGSARVRVSGHQVRRASWCECGA